MSQDGDQTSDLPSSEHYGGQGGEAGESEWTWDCSEDRPKRVRRSKATLWEKAESGKQKVEMGRAPAGSLSASGGKATPGTSFESPEMAESLWAPGGTATVSMFEDEAYRRVVEGVPKPIFKQGVLIGERRLKSERMLKFLLVANAPEKYGKRDMRPIRPEDEPGRKEFTAKHNALVREDAELNQAFQDWILCTSAERNGRVPPCTQGRQCTIYGCGAKGLMCDKVSPPTPSGKASPCTPSACGGEGAELGSEKDEIKIMSKIHPTQDCYGGQVKIKNGIGSESGGDPPSSEHYGGLGAEGGDQRSEDREQRSDQTSEAGSAGELFAAERGSEQDKIMSKSMIKSKTEVDIGSGGENGNQGRDQMSEGRDQSAEDGSGREAVGKEVRQPPAGNAEEAGVEGTAPQEEAGAGGEKPEREKEPWRYDPYEVSRKIREAEKARRMRRRQIDV